MKALELIDQLITRYENSPPTLKQLEFLKSLVNQELGTDDGNADKIKHFKKVAAALRREITISKANIAENSTELSFVLNEINALTSNKKTPKKNS